jgi:hypothetical protein
MHYLCPPSFFQAAPVIVICLGCAGGAGQYTCYYVDDATNLDFNNALPNWLAIVLNVLRFTSLLHMFCGYSLFLVVPVCVIIVSQLSMKEFKGTVFLLLLGLEKFFVPEILYH